jgi:hypothetical protein
MPADVTPQAERLLRYFEYDHLPEPLRMVSHSFYVLAHSVARLDSADGAEQTTALRKLLEAKDCAVRSILGVNASRANGGQA